MTKLMQASVLVATYRRPDDLRRCIAGLQAGDRVPDEIVIVHRRDDHASAEVIAELTGLPLKVALVDEPGVVAAINLGLDQVTGDFVAVMDDDAIPHADWLARIERLYAERPKVGAIGGRDIVHHGTYVHQPSKDRVGLISWYGRLIGNHHIGQGGVRPVHVLKGVNMSFRTAALGDARADLRLLGTGAQVHFEVGLCNAIRRKGWELLYDSEILVDHFPAVRHDEDARAGFSDLAQYNSAHNEQVMILDALPGWGRMPFVLWSFAVGTRQVPGLVQLPRLLVQRDHHAVARTLSSWRGRAAGLATWWRA